ncbi:TPA: hypothetical protein HA244_01200 [Candidatus Micrarchaeota archaeon]|nr:hypothetical protein [Candidatus Micrarchaeota archaeon]
MVSGISAITTKLFIVLLLGLAFVFAGCSSSQPAASPTPELPVASSPSPLPSVSVEASASPSIAPTPTLSPAQQLERLRDAAGGAVSQAFNMPVSFTIDKDPASGAITYYGVGSKSTFDFQVTVAKSIATKWPADITLAQKTGASGRTKTIAFTQTKFGGDKRKTEMQMECNGFTQLITLTVTESDTPVLTFQDYGGAATLKLIDICP